VFTIASASGNTFAYVWKDEVSAHFDGSRWARVLCPRDGGLGLDGLFLLSPPREGQPWVMDHWDTDGAFSFCSNGTRAAASLEGAPPGTTLEVRSSGEFVLLNRRGGDVGIRMPEGSGFGLQPAPNDLESPSVFGWIGNPQLIVEVPSVDTIDLSRLAFPLRHHAAYPEGTNVNVLEVLEPGRARIRSWERGVEGETLCCGTGTAVAGAWLAQRTGISRWVIQPAGQDPVTVTVSMHPDGTWRELWLSGLVRVLGQFHPLNAIFSH
jgi:diaminopimelate epimerase